MNNNPILYILPPQDVRYFIPAFLVINLIISAIISSLLPTVWLYSFFATIAMILVYFQLHEEGISIKKPKWDQILFLTLFILFGLVPKPSLVYYVFPFLFIYPLSHIWAGLRNLDSDFLVSSFIIIAVGSLFTFITIYVLQFYYLWVPDTLLLPDIGESTFGANFCFWLLFFFNQLYQNSTGLQRQPIRFLSFNIPHRVLDIISSFFSLSTIIWISFITPRDSFYAILLSLVYLLIVAIPAVLLLSRGNVNELQISHDESESDQ